MDQESFQKWKEEIQLERQEQLNKAKELQKNTLQRRKAMEKKIQLEAAKEEKRRKEALAERRAQHVEATMRYQRGLKHFKANKEKISLEDVLNKISPSKNRGRTTFDDDKVIVFNKELYKNRLLSNDNINKLKKSISYDNLNNLNMYENSIKNIHNVNNNQLMNNSNNDYKKIEANNKNPNFSQILIENQKTIQEFSKESLKNFQNMISNEIKSKEYTYTTNTDKFLIFEQHFEKLQSNNNVLANLNECLVQNELQKKLQEKEICSKININNENFSDITSVDDLISNKEIETDDMDTDSLANHIIIEDSLNFPSDIEKKINESNNKTYETNFLNSNGYFNLIDPNFSTKHANKNESNFSNKLKKNLNSKVNVSNIEENEKNNISKKFNHFLNSTRLNELNFSNKNIIAIQKNSDKQEAFIYKQNNEKNQIKSILKRSSSLDNGFNVISLLNPMPKFGLNSDYKIEIKDSVELANDRLGSANSKKSSTHSDIHKKSVRFASQINHQEIDKINNISDIDSHNTKSKFINNLAENFDNLKLDVKNKISLNSNLMNSRISSANSIRRPIIRPRNSVLSTKTNQTTTQQLVQSEKLINETGLTLLTELEDSLKINTANLSNVQPVTVYDEKPPAYPTPSALLIGNIGSYALLSQKRKEFIKNIKQNSERSINSPKLTSVKLESALLSISKNSNLNKRINNKHISCHEKIGQTIQIPNNINQEQTLETTQEKNKQVVTKPPEATTYQIGHYNQLQQQECQNSFLNIKNNETNDSEYPETICKNELNANKQPCYNMNAIMNQNVNKFCLNSTDPNLLHNNSNVSLIGDCILNDLDLNQIPNNLHKQSPFETKYTLTKIPLSPKTNLKANYLYSNLNNERQENINIPSNLKNVHNSFQTNLIASSKPQTFVSNTSAVLSVNQEASLENANISGIVNQQMPKTHIRFAYLNTNNQNITFTPQLQLNNSYGKSSLEKRTFSADNLCPHARNTSKQIGRQINDLQQHPSYQTNFNSNRVTDSMAAFLKAEEMSRECSESQIMDVVKEIDTSHANISNNRIKNGQILTLSIEEQNVKNSIMRLNERLRMLKNDNNQRRYSQNESIVCVNWRN